MAYLWIILAGAIVFAAASFLPWLGISLLGSVPQNFNMWMAALYVVQNVVQWNVETVMNLSLWLLPICVAAILVLASIQLVSRRMLKKLTTWMFILSLIPLPSLLWLSSTFLPVLKAVMGIKGSLDVIIVFPEIGYFLTVLGFLTIIVGSVIGVFSKKRTQQ